MFEGLDAEADEEDEAGFLYTGAEDLPDAADLDDEVLRLTLLLVVLLEPMPRRTVAVLLPTLEFADGLSEPATLTVLLSVWALSP